MAILIGLNLKSKVDATLFPDDMPVPDVGLRLRCSRCGGRNVYTMADWSASDWLKRHGGASGNASACTEGA